jgi:hypothetical protein
MHKGKQLTSFMTFVVLLICGGLAMWTWQCKFGNVDLAKVIKIIFDNIAKKKRK